MGADDVDKVVTGDLYSYGTRVFGMYVDGLSANLATTLGLEQTAQMALVPLPAGSTSPLKAGSGTFPGAQLIAIQQARARAGFHQALNDLSTGLQAIGSAVTVIASSYDGNEASSAAKISDVMYAFADPESTRPTRLPDFIDGHTMQDAAAPGAPVPQALTAADTDATEVTMDDHGVSVDGVSPVTTVRSVFADGSVREVTQSGAIQTNDEVSGALGLPPGPGLAVTQTTVSTYRAADGTVLRETSETDVTQQGVKTATVVRSGATTTTATMNGGSAHVVVTRTKPDGHTVTVASSSSAGEPAPSPGGAGTTPDYLDECLVPGPLEVAQAQVLQR